MLVQRVMVDVTMARTPLASRWASERWDAIAVEPLADLAAIGELPRRASVRRRLALSYAAFAVELHRSEAGGYHLNITAPLPKAFVMLRAAEDGRDPPLRPKLVTVRLQSGGAHARRRRAGRRGAAAPGDARVAAALRRPALQARAEEEDETQRPFRRRGVPARPGNGALTCVARAQRGASPDNGRRRATWRPVHAAARVAAQAGGRANGRTRNRARGARADAAPATPTASAAAATLPAPPADLPAVESLSFDSDFSLFLQPKVDEQLRRQALKRLFSDPRFNVMDGLDVYIDDYGKPDPIAPELVRQLVQGRYLFDPPQTRVNAQGVVEDVPPDEAAAVPPPADAVAAASALPEVPHDTPAAIPSTASDPAAAAEGSAAAQPSPPADRLP
jgi:hypothetical protein